MRRGFPSSLQLFLALSTLLLLEGSNNCSKTYVASPLEKRWVRNIEKWQEQSLVWHKGCAAWKKDHQKFNTWLHELEENQNHTAPFSESVFSHLSVSCPGEFVRKSYLEPLAVALRHPHFPCAKRSKRFLMSTWLAFPFAAITPHAQARFFDVGSTYFDSGLNGYADSLAWFLHTYRRRGFDFAHIYAWEIRPVDHDSYWKRVPDDYRHRMQFFNTAASANETSGMNPLRLLERVAEPEDFVVFKLDIDNNLVEVSLIQQLLRNPKLTALVDEVFWENHVSHSPTQFHGWGNLISLTGACSTIAGSYGCFQQLRQAGIRAHSWI